jgi:cobalamin biosynthesis Mg chelatase CobN
MGTGMTDETLQLVKQGIATAKAGDIAGASSLFRQAVETDPANQVALLWLSGCLPNDEKYHYLEQARAINPDSEAGKLATAALQQVQAHATSTTTDGKQHTDGQASCHSPTAPHPSGSSSSSGSGTTPGTNAGTTAQSPSSDQVQTVYEIPQWVIPVAAVVILLAIIVVCGVGVAVVVLQGGG